MLEHYEHGTVQLVDTGMYQFASQNVPFMVYIEAYQSNESSTLLSELGMRHKDVKVRIFISCLCALKSGNHNPWGTATVCHRRFFFNLQTG